ncbi:hypothetical protein ACFHW2_11785 [Actinomadura sp. LOL_016]|uniref:hypothetical protein n=1 Tax=unclassified Actinomadura TaxID=2626254 RepID=UPI003A7FDF07
MARHYFGRTLTDWTMTTGDTGVVSVEGGAEITFWSAAVGGVQYTDLLSAAGSPATFIVSSDGSDGLTVGTIPQFQGPDGVTEMWADAGGGARYKMIATDLGSGVNDLETRLANVENLVANLDALGQHVVLAVTYDVATSTWPSRPAIAGTRRVYWHGPNATPPPAGYMVENDQFFGWA